MAKTNRAAWSFYSYEKSEFDQLNEAIQKAGQPNSDQNDSQEINS